MSTSLSRTSGRNGFELWVALYLLERNWLVIASYDCFDGRDESTRPENAEGRNAQEQRKRVQHVKRPLSRREATMQPL